MDTRSRGPLRSTIGPRPLMVAAWIVALPVFTIVSVVNLTLSDSPFFFLTRNLSPLVLAVLWVVLIVFALTVTTALFALARKFIRARWYRIAVGLVVFIIGLFLVGNVVARSADIIFWQPLQGGILRWLLLIGSSLVLGLVVLFTAGGLLTLLSQRQAGIQTSRGDLLAVVSQPYSAPTLAIMWVLILGYLLTNPALTEFRPLSFGIGRWVLTVLAAGAFAYIVLRLTNSGLTTLGVATAIAIAPLILAATETDPYRDRAISFKPDTTNPNILWVVVDELQSTALLDANGKVLDIFPNLAALQERSTTYTNVYMTAPRTDVALPTMLNGVADPNSLKDKEIKQVQRSSGVLSWLDTHYEVTSHLEWFDLPFNPRQLGESRAERNSNWADLLASITLLAKDTIAVAGRLTLHSTLADFFPELEGRWTNFWDGAPNEQVDPDFDMWLPQLQASGTPLFAFWHNMDVHIPLQRDLQGKRLPVDWGTLNWHMPLSEAEVELTRRLYLAAIMEFDRKLGHVLEVFERSHSLDDALIIVSSDHGRSFVPNEPFRGGPTLAKRWSEVAHVPLIVKYPHQKAASVVQDKKSNGQIAATILEWAGVEALSGPPLSSGLNTELKPFPSPYGWNDEEANIWFRQATDFESTPWTTEVMPALRESNPFHLGSDLRDFTDPADSLALQATVLDWSEQTADSDLVALQVEVDPRQCSGSEVGHIRTENHFVASVVWTQITDDAMLGWGLMPAPLTEQPEVWCLR